MNAPGRESYEPHIKAMWPHVAEEELELRSSLLYMRDRALATKIIERHCAGELSALQTRRMIVRGGLVSA